jgi:hypothetical protein
VALALASAVNLYYFSTGTDLTVVVARTLFADMLLVLSLVPFYMAVLVRNSESTLSMTEKIKSGMKPVAMYTFLLALITYVLFHFYGGPLVESRLLELTEKMNASIALGEMTLEQSKQQLDLAKQIYSPSSQVLVVLLGNLFTGFISSILASVLVRR